jgi:hypothetical protein
MCLPSRYLETSCITPLFYCCMRVLQRLFLRLNSSCMGQIRHIIIGSCVVYKALKPRKVPYIFVIPVPWYLTVVKKRKSSNLVLQICLVLHFEGFYDKLVVVYKRLSNYLQLHMLPVPWTSSLVHHQIKYHRRLWIIYDMSRLWQVSCNSYYIMIVEDERTVVTHCTL